MNLGPRYFRAANLREEVDRNSSLPKVEVENLLRIGAARHA